MIKNSHIGDELYQVGLAYMKLVMLTPAVVCFVLAPAYFLLGLLG